jgi:hypothetical protein
MIVKHLFYVRRFFLLLRFNNTTEAAILLNVIFKHRSIKLLSYYMYVQDISNVMWPN